MKRKTVPKKIKDFLLIASKHQCSICQANTIDVHHIVQVANGGTNDLDNLMVVCPNHHREYHQGKFSKDQMRTYRTQWIQKCSIFLGIGMPNETLINDQKMASILPIEIKLQFIEQYTNCRIQTISNDNCGMTIYFWSAAQIWSELTRDIISLIQSVFRFFKNIKNLRCTCVSNIEEEKYLGIDNVELYSFNTNMKDIEDFIFGRIQLIELWNKLEFFKKERPNVMENEIIKFKIPRRL